MCGSVCVFVSVSVSVLVCGRVCVYWCACVLLCVLLCVIVCVLLRVGVPIYRIMYVCVGHCVRAGSWGLKCANGFLSPGCPMLHLSWLHSLDALLPCLLPPAKVFADC